MYIGKRICLAYWFKSYFIAQDHPAEMLHDVRQQEGIYATQYHRIFHTPNLEWCSWKELCSFTMKILLNPFKPFGIWKYWLYRWNCSAWKPWRLPSPQIFLLHISLCNRKIRTIDFTLVLHQIAPKVLCWPREHKLKKKRKKIPTSYLVHGPEDQEIAPATFSSNTQGKKL